MYQTTLASTPWLSYEPAAFRAIGIVIGLCDEKAIFKFFVVSGSGISICNTGIEACDLYDKLKQRHCLSRNEKFTKLDRTKIGRQIVRVKIDASETNSYMVNIELSKNTNIGTTWYSLYETGPRIYGYKNFKELTKYINKE